MTTILEFMDSLGVDYGENVIAAWDDFASWWWAMPAEQRPQVVKGGDGRKFVIEQKDNEQ